MARECRHGFGHGVFYVKALQQLGMSGDSYSASQQFRPGAGFLLNETLLCESYRICGESPVVDAECNWGLEHSYLLFGGGPTFDDGSVLSLLSNMTKRCQGPATNY